MRNRAEHRPYAGKRVLTLGASALALVVATADGVIAAEVNWPVEQVAQAGQQRSFDIPPQPLASAVTAFARQSGYQIAADHTALGGLQSPGVSGTLSPEEALVRLLGGTGVSWRASQAGSIILQRTSASGSMELSLVTVEGSAPASGAAADSTWRGHDPVVGYRATMASTGTRLPTTIRETPNSVSVVTRDLIRDRDARTLSEALETVAGFSRMNINRGVELYTLRGFGSNTSNVMAENGLAVGNLVTPDRSGIERYEVLKGPATIVAGGQMVGGAINREVKRAQRERFIEGEASYGFWNRARVEADVNGSLVEGGAVRGRLTAAFEDGDGFVRGTHDRTHAVSPALGFDVLDGTGTVDLVFRHQRTTGVKSAGLPLTHDGNMPDVSRERGIYGTGSTFKSERDSVFLSYDQSLPHDLKLMGRLQYTESAIARRDAFAWGPVQANGTSGIMATFDDNSRDSYGGELSLAKTFEGWGRSQDVLAGISHNRVTSGIRGSWGTMLGRDTVANPSGNFAIPAMADGWNRRLVEEQTGAFAQANIRPLDGLTVVGAVRQDWFKDTTTHVVPNPRVINLRTNSLTYRLGASYEVMRGTTVYGSHATSFTPQAWAIGRTGAPLGPENGQQFEVGVKQDLLGDRLSLTGSIYHIRRQNVARNVGGGVWETVGEQTHKGLELEANGRVTEAISLVASYSFIDAEITGDAPGQTARLGKQPAQVAKHTGSVWAVYDPPSGVLKDWSFGVGAYARGAVFVDDLEQVKVPGYVRLDAQVGYQITEAIKATVHAENLTDVRYIVNPSSQWGGNHFGAPVNVVGRLNFRF